jgi:hypothetical protein
MATGDVLNNILTAIRDTAQTVTMRQRKKEQPNDKQTQLYKVFIALHVSTLWGHHQADF